MPKQSLKQKIKEAHAKQQLKKNANANKKTKHQKYHQQKARESSTFQNSISNDQNFKTTKINFNSKRNNQKLNFLQVTKTLPKGVKIVDKYSLYEPLLKL